MYILVQADDIHIFRNSVQESLTEGWRPQGGVSVTYDGSGLMYTQAMVKDL